MTSKFRKNIFQVWVLRNNSSFLCFTPHYKFVLFPKSSIFKICIWDEFLLGWVLMWENGEFDVWRHFLHHDDVLLTILLFLKNPNFFGFLKSEIWNFEISKNPKLLKIDCKMCLWHLHGSSNIISLLKKFLAHSTYLPIFTHKYFQKLPIFTNSTAQVHHGGVLRDEFLWTWKFFHQKVWVLKNILHIHHVVISPIDQKL